MSLEAYFAPYRANIIGINQDFESPFGRQRIVYADNECNYCARCQTGGRVLADRSLSRLLKDDWPRTLPGD